MIPSSDVSPAIRVLEERCDAYFEEVEALQRKMERHPTGARRYRLKDLKSRLIPRIQGEICRAMALC